jgi:Cutinase
LNGGATHSADARRRAWRRVAPSGVAIQLAGAAILVALCVTYSGATKAIASSGCTDFTYFGVRGAGAAQGAGIADEISDIIANGLPPGTTTSTVGLPYPAPDGSSAFVQEMAAGIPPVLSNVLEIGWTAAGGASFTAFSDAIEAGASAMFSGPSSLSALVNSCPNNRIVLVGLSMGDMVIDYGLTVAARTGRASRVFQHISAILLYGDPLHLPGSPSLQYDVGEASAYGLLAKWEPDVLKRLDSDGGLPPNYVPSVPKQLQSETQSYCFSNDPLCDTSACCAALGIFNFCRLVDCNNPTFPPLDTPHNHYGDLARQYATAGAAFAVSKMTADLAIDLRTTGQCIVAGSGRSGTNLVGLTAPVTSISTPPLPAGIQASLPAIYNANNGAPLVQGETLNYEIDFERPVTNLVIGVKINGFTVATEYYQGPAAMRVSSNGDPYVLPALPPGVYGRIPYEVDVSGDVQCVASGTIWIPSPPGAKAVTVTAAVAAALFLILLAAFV